MNMYIRKTNEQDRKTIYQVEDQAFDDPEVPVLADQLLDDPTANPLSLLAFDGEQAVGHILFTKGWLEGFEELSVSILAPLAVIPSHQKQGVGGQLIRAGLELLKQQRVDLVFVLGHIEYYPRHGFTPALPQGFIPPYPTKAGLEDAWMVQAISAVNLAKYAGKVQVAEMLDKPEHW